MSDADEEYEETKGWSHRLQVENITRMSAHIKGFLAYAGKLQALSTMTPTAQFLVAEKTKALLNTLEVFCGKLKKLEPEVDGLIDLHALLNGRSSTQLRDEYALLLTLVVGLTEDVSRGDISRTICRLLEWHTRFGHAEVFRKDSKEPEIVDLLKKMIEKQGTEICTEKYFRFIRNRNNEQEDF